MKKTIERLTFENHFILIDYQCKDVTIRNYKGSCMNFEFPYIVNYFLQKKEYISNCNMYILVLRFCIAKMRNDE